MKLAKGAWLGGWASLEELQSYFNIENEAATILWADRSEAPQRPRSCVVYVSDGVPFEHVSRDDVWDPVETSWRLLARAGSAREFRKYHSDEATDAFVRMTKTHGSDM